jgi:hypothetical protein
MSHHPDRGERDLNGLDSLISVRGYFERILRERDERDKERDRRLDERFEAQEKAVNAALAAAEKAVNAALSAAEKAVEKAEASQQRVNETQNEFRGTLKDQAADLMPRAETELLVRDMRSRLDEMSGTRREGVGLSADAAARVVTIVIAAVAAIAAIAALYLAAHG